MYLDLETYLRPETVAECLAALSAPGTTAIAGGTYLNARGHEHVRHLVDLQALPLGGLEVGEDNLRIGALTPLSELVGVIDPDFASVGAAATAERNLAIRNRSTVGGRISRDRSDARLATALLAVNAQIEVLSVGNDGIRERIMPLGRYLSDVAAGVTGRIVAGVLLESSPAFSAYLDAGPTAVGPPTADAALGVCVDGSARVVSGGHAADASGTLLLPRTSLVVGALHDPSQREGWAERVRQAALGELPAYGDAFASGEYRRELAATLIVRLVGSWLDGREG